MVKLPVYSVLKDQLQGGHSLIGPGSQVASSEGFGTLGVIAVCRQLGLLGFVTSRHVAVNLNEPLQNMYHPVPPGLGPSLLLGTTTGQSRLQLTICGMASSAAQDQVRSNGRTVLTFSFRVLAPSAVPLL